MIHRMLHNTKGETELERDCGTTVVKISLLGVVVALALNGYSTLKQHQLNKYTHTV